MLAAVNDVPWKAAEAKREFTGEVEEGASGREYDADDEESAAEVAERIHGKKMTQRSKEVKR